MEITLHKASKLAKQVFAASKKVPVSLAVTLSIYNEQPVDRQIKDARQIMLANLGQQIELNDVGFAIRELIGQANASSGINTLMNERAKMESRQTLATVMISVTDPGDDVTAFPTLQAKLSSMRKRAESMEIRSRYGSPEDEVRADVLSKANVDSFKDELTKIRYRLSQISDDLMQKNWTTKIRLSDDIVATLKKHSVMI